MLIIDYLDKNDKLFWLPKLFDLMCENMRHISSNALTYKEQCNRWIKTISDALEKPNRMIIVCFIDGFLAGFVQYYTRNDLIMIEELQIEKNYHSSALLLHICRFLLEKTSDDIAYIEAYAERENFHSQNIMCRLGMKKLDDTSDSHFLHFRGTVEKIRRFSGKKQNT